MKKQELKKGDYVLATKWEDGSPSDHFVVGFYSKPLEYGIETRHEIVDSMEISFRGNGFRRVKKITPERGKFILRNIKTIERGRYSVWHYARTNIEKAEKWLTPIRENRQ